MTFPSDAPLEKKDLQDFGTQRARDLAFDAVRALWQRRKAAGMKQVHLARKIDRNPGWVSKALSGPRNWTMRTFGQLVVGLDGEIEIYVRAMEDMPQERLNYDAYDGYRPMPFEIRKPGPRTIEKDGTNNAVTRIETKPTFLDKPVVLRTAN